ncbi:cd331607-0bfb-4601-871a-14c92c4da29d [Sclerotinia trifoliorum]|uniref:non-specific serine/threonine protein kinase n=1 Tax=Sclerotinia trifoliorum TaxID=28548 RepID=A0A8H2W2F9_9HELO|nr:cd331607-0bfb-4601-871a-14c92c4da29d [Sclerotinia trifoliorum]
MKCYVALKILAAQSTDSDNPNESSIYEYLAQNTLSHPGKDHIISLKDSFKHQGPNGEHTCLVFTAMGPSTATVVEHLPEELLGEINPKNRYPIWMARSVLQQVLLAFFKDRPPKKLVTPVSLRSPETILKEIPTSNQDIWSFGCLIFEFITGRPLFVVDNTGDENDTNDDHILQLSSTLGPIP